MRNSRYNAGVDSTPRVRGDVELCLAIHGVSVNDCHLDSPTFWESQAQRAQYEMAVLAGARDGSPTDARLCPVWQFKTASELGRCHNQQSGVSTSCDHFGNVVFRDDPQTPEFEGQPAECGAQQDEFGPYAGFFTIPQVTSGIPVSVRACLPLHEGDNTTCAPWIPVTWR